MFPATMTSYATKQMASETEYDFSEIQAILDSNPEPRDVSFCQMIIQEKSPGDWRAFLSFYSEETGIRYRLRDYGTTPGEAADNAYKSFNDEDLRWFNIDKYELLKAT